MIMVVVSQFLVVVMVVVSTVLGCHSGSCHHSSCLL